MGSRQRYYRDLLTACEREIYCDLVSIEKLLDEALLHPSRGRARSTHMCVRRYACERARFPVEAAHITAQYHPLATGLWRGIALLSFASLLWARALLVYLKSTMDK